jgi:hypothetical protein
VSLSSRSRPLSPSCSAFAGFRFPAEVIVLAVRWYLLYGLSHRDSQPVPCSHDGPLYRIALTPRMRRTTHPRLPRPAHHSGRTRREALRCLKRYIAREIYWLIRQLDLDEWALRTA